MPFDEDIFISYAHLDNQPLAEGLDGWVEALHKRLKILLAQLLGEDVSIWRDRKLQGNDVFGETLVERVSRSRVLVSVLSPRYVKSEWCVRELETFCRAAQGSGGLTVGDKSRVFKVLKTHVPIDEHPEAVRGLLGYEFYEYDAERGRAREFSPEISPQKDPRYWAALDDLAWDIKLTLDKVRAAEAQPAPAAAGQPAAVSAEEQPPEKTVYLAASTKDVAEERDRLRRELQQRGYLVLPDRELSLCEPEFSETVREHLSRASLSAHLVGSSYGIVPEGAELSVVQLQERLAAERGAAGQGFTRLIWVPPGLDPREERQRRFVGELHTQLGSGAELLQTSVEDLKLRVLEKLTPKQKAAPAADADPDAPKRVYLICDNRDQEEVQPIDDFLYEQGFEVIPSVFDGDSAQVAQFHRESLLSCDAALVYYGNANQMWLRSKLWDLQKAQGWGRPEPLRARAVYVSGPESAEKQRFRTREVPVVIQHFSPFSPDALSPFLQAIRAE